MVFLVWKTGLPGSMEASLEALFATHFLHCMGMFILFCCTDIWMCPTLTFLSQNSIQISSQIRDAVHNYLQHVGMHQMNLPVNLLYLPLIPGEATSGSLRSSVQDRDLLELVQWKKTSKFKGLEHLSYEDMLGETGLLSPDREESEGCYQCI